MGIVPNEIWIKYDEHGHVMTLYHAEPGYQRYEVSGHECLYKREREKLAADRYAPLDPNDTENVRCGTCKYHEHDAYSCRRHAPPWSEIGSYSWCGDYEPEAQCASSAE